MAVTASSISRTRTVPSFYLCMTLLMASLVFAGFGMSYWFPMLSGSLPPAPPVVHVHGWVYSSWMILLVVQSALVNTGKVALHRSLGMFGIAHATAVLFMGLTITLLGGAGGVNRPSPDFWDAMYLSLCAILGFALLFTLSMRHTRQPEIHRRLMLFAILPLLPPGINRLYMLPFNLPAIPVLPLYLTLWALAAMLLAHEWWHHRRLGRYSLIGAGWILLQGLLHVPVANSESFIHFFRGLATLVYYR